MQNVSGGVHEDCVLNKAEEDQWQCLFAAENYKYIQTPVFVSNSVDVHLFVPLMFLGNGFVSSTVHSYRRTSSH